MRATMRQVAEKAGVSRMTVSNVLLGRDEIVSPATREKVIHAAKSLNYVPVHTGFQNRRTTSNVIGVEIGFQNISVDLAYSLTFEGLCLAAEARGYDLLTLLRAQSESVLGRTDLNYLDRRCDGFIFARETYGAPQLLVETLTAHRIPTVVCFRRDVPEGAAWVDIDNQSAMLAAVERLVELGHQNIAYVAGPPNISDEVQRRRAFQNAMLQKSLEPLLEAEFEHATSPHRWNSRLTALLTRGITGLVCFNDALGVCLLDAALRCRVEIPEQLSVIGMDDASPQTASRGLTTVGFSFRDVGRLAVESWVELHAGLPGSACNRLVPVELRERNTTGVPPSQ